MPDKTPIMTPASKVLCPLDFGALPVLPHGQIVGFCGVFRTFGGCIHYEERIMNCPFLNSDNPHCSEHLNMNKLDEAFNLCTNHYMMCPIYMEISQDKLELIAVGAETTKAQ